MAPTDRREQFQTHIERSLREEIAEATSNETFGGGIRRFHFEKRLF